MGARTIGVGLVGYGLAGSVFHAPLICAEPHLRLRAVVTRRRNEVERDLSAVKVVSSIDDLLGDREVELVVVASPNDTHAPLAAAALKAGKHVVVDKPFTLTIAEADELISLAKKYQRLLTIFHNRRWDGGFLTLQQVLRKGSLGRYAYYEAHYDRFRPEIKPGWREQSGPGSGLFYDLGPHLIDQALVLFGMATSVNADVTRQRPQAQADDYFHVVLAYPHMRAILHGSNLVREPGPRLLVHGTSGSFLQYGEDQQENQLKTGLRPGMQGWGAPDPNTHGVLVPADGRKQTIPTLPGSYEKFYAGIADAIERDAPPPVTAEDARRVMLVLEAARRSAVEKCTITLPADQA